MKEKVNYKNIFKDGLITSNPVLVSLLGLCPVLAITTSIDNAIGMTFAVLLVLVLSNITISAIRKLVPDEIRIPIFIIVIATFVSCIELLMNAFTPTLYESLGLFIPLITVNCLILGRAEAFASKNKVLPSIVDGVGMALGYGLALFIVAFFREIIATQSLTISNPFNTAQYITFALNKDVINLSISFFATPAGAFIMLAIVIAVISAIQGAVSKRKALKKGDK
ncbi:MAG: electron transport complex subunit RsxE [Bacilli bacterium]|nr:electron transport complex subunit RsxE [Bacilli bacterium]